MKCSLTPVVFCLFAAVLLIAGSPALATDIGDARRDIAAMRYAKAEAELVDIAKSSSGEQKQEALSLLGGLKKSVSEAEIILQEVVRLNPSNRWGVAAEVELAKMRYAMGDYATALDMLEKASSCGESDEACYFGGLCGLMLKRYEEAKTAFSRVKSARYRSWAAIGLGEAEIGLENREEGCRRYHSVAQSAGNPTAMYRYGECLEEQGEIESATEVFEEVAGKFEDSPEALLAGQKLRAIRSTPPSQPQTLAESQTGGEPGGTPPLTTGFTLQFGSFQDRTNAIKLAAELKRDLPGIRIDSDLVDYKEVHRVRYGFFKSRVEAERRAEEVTRQIGEPCAIMPLP
jgi:tetratricopeptide (TPR) repeat protein